MKSKISQTSQSFQHQPILKLKANQLNKIFAYTTNFSRHWQKSYKRCKLKQGDQIFNFGYFDRFSKFFQTFAKNALFRSYLSQKSGPFGNPQFSYTPNLSKQIFLLNWPEVGKSQIGRKSSIQSGFYNFGRTTIREKLSLYNFIY